MTTSVDDLHTVAEKLADRYQITVVFTRYLSEDLDHIMDKPGQFDEELVNQFVGELDEVMKQYGLPAGYFDVTNIEFWDNKPGGWQHRFEVGKDDDGRMTLDQI